MKELMDKKEQHYNELSFYTLAHQDRTFIHQHIVDAQIAQTADEKTKSISITFSLVGLYLYVEKNFTGRQVQQFHMVMGKNKRQWPEFVLPALRGNMTVSDVLAASAGPERDKRIRKWCVTVWEAYKENRATIINLTEQFLP
jgi:hypothetical protein